jgi:hypothetical protein
MPILNSTSRVRRLAFRGAALVLACVAVAACEAVPTVRFEVRESSESLPVAFAEDGYVKDPPAVSYPIRDAIVLLPSRRCTLDLSELASRLRTDSTVTQRMHPPIGDDQGGDGAYAMRTSAGGTAEYSELRLFRFFVPPPRVERQFFVWAEGYEPRVVTIELGTASGHVEVPLTRVPAR